MAKTRVLRTLLAASALAVWLGACEDKPREAKLPSDEDAGEEQLKGVDPELAEAVANAKKSGKNTKATEEGGPPESGVFEPGKADEQLKPGAPPKIALGSAGNEPRVALGDTVSPGWKQSGSIELSLKMGRNALPELGVGLSIEATKPKAPASGAEPAAAATGGQPMVAKIEKLGFTTDVGADGKDTLAQLAKLRGSRVEFRIVQGGVGVDYGYTLSKGADQNLGTLVMRALSEAVETATLGFPKETVGAGGYWLITTRGSVNGAEVVSYRMVKLEKVEGDTLSLSVNTKRYAVSTKLDLPGLAPGTEVAQFQSLVEGTLTAQKHHPMASSGSTKQSFQAALIQPSQPQQPLMFQAESDTTFKLGKQ